jgi:hypothetical protein
MKFTNYLSLMLVTIHRNEFIHVFLCDRFSVTLKRQDLLHEGWLTTCLVLFIRVVPKRLDAHLLSSINFFTKCVKLFIRLKTKNASKQPSPSSCHTKYVIL